MGEEFAGKDPNVDKSFIFIVLQIVFLLTRVLNFFFLVFFGHITSHSPTGMLREPV